MLNVSDHLAYIEPNLCNKMCLGVSTYRKVFPTVMPHNKKVPIEIFNMYVDDILHDF